MKADALRMRQTRPSSCHLVRGSRLIDDAWRVQEDTQRDSAFPSHITARGIFQFNP
jgi:hypothetical protein